MKHSLALSRCYRLKVHRKNVNYKGYIHHATKDDRQYESKSDKSDHVALHNLGRMHSGFIEFTATVARGMSLRM
jgi:hypothetical protein